MILKEYTIKKYMKKIKVISSEDRLIYEREVWKWLAFLCAVGVLVMFIIR